jgi:molybdopterin molybdotransferase
MLEVADALAIVLQHAGSLRPVMQPLSSALLNQVLAVDVRADRDSPPFDKSLRDGYAVRSGNYGTDLLVIEEIAAGKMPTKSVGRGECARIFTGAPIPDGADAVVMVEDTEANGEHVRILDASVKAGQWIFRRGTEMRAGEVVLPAGTKLNAAAIGLLATIGGADVPVFSWPRVGIIATGDEIVPVDAEPGPGQIRNSNGSMLTAQACAVGASVRDLGIARDTESELKEVVGRALADSEVVLLAGGVSAGKFDLVPGVLEHLGVTAHFHKVRMKPGKPLLFGTVNDKLVFGLPGNPVSAFVCFELFVRPALRKMAGDREPASPIGAMPLAESISEVNDRPTYRPAKMEGAAVRSLPWAGAPDLRAMAFADALIALPPGESRLDVGMPVNVIRLNG